MVAVEDRVTVPTFRGLAGVATRDVTPPVGIRARNWGPADWDAATGHHRPLELTAVALAGHTGDPVLVIAVDGTWWRRVDDERRCRGAVLAATGLPEDRVLLSLSHTHAGPVLCAADADLPGGELIAPYLEALAGAAADAAREAVATMVPAALDWAVGRCGLASNRELLLTDGCGAAGAAGPRPVVGHNPDPDDGPADDTVLVGRLSRLADTAAMATIVNYACHPTTMAWQGSVLSPDYVGAMRELVASATGAPVAFLQGASGELAPAHQYTGDTAVADRHGTGLGHAVLAALATLPPVGTELTLTGVVESGAPLAMWQPRPRTSPAGADPATVLTARRSEVTLDLRPLPSLAELEQQWAGIDPRSRAERLQRARNLRDGYVTGPTVQHPLWVWRLGTALLVAHPGEAYSRLQRTLRAHVGDWPVVVVNLTNGPGFVYLPTRSAYRVDAYQAWQTPLVPGSLERLESAACRQLDRVRDDREAVR